MVHRFRIQTLTKELLDTLYLNSPSDDHTAVLREAWAMLPESSSRPLAATLAQSRNLAHASLETAVKDINGEEQNGNTSNEHPSKMKEAGSTGNAP